MRFSTIVASIALLSLRSVSATFTACCDHTPISVPQHPSAEVYTSIQQTLALFPVAIDSKSYGLLDQVFTDNATSYFLPGPGNQPAGLQNITIWLDNLLTGLVSQHSLSTLQINQTTPCTATSINYLVGAFFGQGDATGQYWLDFGYYQDQLVKDGTSNKWLVQDRVLYSHVFQSKGTIGNESFVIK